MLWQFNRENGILSRASGYKKTVAKSIECLKS